METGFRQGVLLKQDLGNESYRDRIEARSPIETGFRQGVP